MTSVSESDPCNERNNFAISKSFQKGGTLERRMSCKKKESLVPGGCSKGKDIYEKFKTCHLIQGWKDKPRTDDGPSTAQMCRMTSLNFIFAIAAERN